MSAIASVSTPSRRRSRPVPWLLIGGYVGALLDLLAAAAYWAPRGIAPMRIPQSIASWLLGPGAFEGGVLTAVFGVLFYGQLVWGLASLYHAAAQRHPLLLRRPFACGSIYGMVAYVGVFQIAAPLLFGVRPVTDPVWGATCLLVYAFLVGVPCALSARLAHGVSR